MDFALTREQLDLQNAIREFAQSELNDGLTERDRRQEFNHDGWRQCAARGIQGLAIPEQFGGGGRDPVAVMAALEGLGRGCRDNGLWFALNAQAWGCAAPLLAFGSDDQKQRCLPRFCSGEWIGAMAMSEPEAGSDAFSLQTRAERVADGYVLNGRKVYITNGPVADVVIVMATINPGDGARGITAFLVEKDAPGFAMSGPVEKMGLRTVPMAELELSDCRVPAAARLGGEGAGVAVFTHAMEWERGFILAGAVGAMQRQWETCRAFARSRRQFGRAIGAFQQVSGMLVDMQMRLEAARLFLYRVGWLKASNRNAVREAAMAKLYISEAWVQSCQDAIQVHGGHGYLTESGIERDLRDALASRLYSGTSEIQRQVLAQWMGLG